MASALLVSRNEASWAESKVCMRKYTNTVTNSSNNSLFNLNPNPNPNPQGPQPNPFTRPKVFNRSQHHVSHTATSGVHFRQSEGTPVFPVSSDGRISMSLGEVNESIDGGYVSFNLRAYSRGELKELQKRLILELEQVRNLRSRIETECFGSGSTYSDSQFSVSRSTPVQLNEVFGSDKRKPIANGCYPASGFETEKKKTKKEILDPIEKNLSGFRRRNPFDLGKDLKRTAVDPVAGKHLTGMMKRCGQILTKLMKHKFGWVFNAPVDAGDLGLHDYHLIIKNPMDLGTVKSNIEKDLYRSPLDFASDVRLTFNNALLYNAKGTDVNIMAGQLSSRFNEMFNPAYKKFEAEELKIASVDHKEPQKRSWTQPMVVEQCMERVPELIVKPSQAASLDPPPIQASYTTMEPTQAMKSVLTPTSRPVKLPKPRAKDLSKREMSYEEKARLGTSLQSLPPEKMGQLVHILRKRNGNLAHDGDEIELDIEAVDTETLWELDRFVSNYKKMVSKIKRQGLMNNDNQVSASQTSCKSPAREYFETVASAQKSKKGEIGEEDVDIGEEIPIENFPPVVIDKDPNICASGGSSSSASSSSSGDSSSSSDSDSGSSSSGSDSDADSVHSPFVETKAANET